MLGEHDALALGTLEQIRQKLDELLKAITAADELGVVERPEFVSWGALGFAESDYRGTFKTVIVVNTGANPVRVGFNRSDVAADANAWAVLSARGFIVIPYRGSSVFVGGALAGSAAILFARTAQPFNAGTM